MEDDLVAWGKVIRLETIGRRTGSTRSVTVGFVQEPAGPLLLAAGSKDASWSANLRAEPRCQATLAGRRRSYVAVPLSGAERQAAVAALILKYGTPAERLGNGPVFRLQPTDIDTDS